MPGLDAPLPHCPARRRRSYAGDTAPSRAERSTWSALDEHGDSVNPLTVKYLNRLSDLLLILSRVASTDSHGGTGDILWVPVGSMASATSRR